MSGPVPGSIDAVARIAETTDNAALRVECVRAAYALGVFDATVEHTRAMMRARAARIEAALADAADGAGRVPS